MRKKTKIVSAIFGTSAGVAGMEHGIFEILQGNIKPAALMFASMGPPCVPEISWCACEPAMSILPDLLITGILAVIISLLIIICSVFFLHQKYASLIIIFLSVVLLLFGGGFFPPVFGITAGIIGFWIHKPLAEIETNSIISLSAKMWPWPIVLFLSWSICQFIIGYFFNDFLKNAMPFIMPFFIATIPLSVFAAYASDVMGNKEYEPVSQRESSR